MFRHIVRSATLGLALAAIATPAQAHHPMGGTTPTNIFEGLLSGLGHPIIGPDHFAFVVAIGLLSAMFARGYYAPLGFVAATVVGTFLHLVSVDLPIPEIVIALSVVVGGGLLVWRKQIGLVPFVAGISLAGLFHGYAYGEAIVGAGMEPLVAYLLGFAVIQTAVSVGAFFAVRTITERRGPAAAVALRAAGGVVAAVGVVFLVSAVPL